MTPSSSSLSGIFSSRTVSIINPSFIISSWRGDELGRSNVLKPPAAALAAARAEFVRSVETKSRGRAPTTSTAAFFEPRRPHLSVATFSDYSHSFIQREAKWGCPLLAGFAPPYALALWNQSRTRRGKDSVSTNRPGDLT